MIKKTFYEAPETELILVRFEDNFCGTNGDPGKAGQDLGKGNSFTFDDEDD